MANEIRLDYGSTGETLYMLVFNSSGSVWNGSAFETIEADNWATYDIALTEQDGTGIYWGSFPAGVSSSGRYDVSIYEQQGASPATTDYRVGQDSYSVGFSSSGVSDGWPTSTDLGDFLTAAGYDYGSADLDLAIGEAVEEWEKRTGYKPFLRDSSDQTLYFDPPGAGSFGCVLDVRHLLTLTSLSYGLEEDGTGGTAMAQGTDFVMLPYDGGANETPWTHVRFLSNPYGGARSIKVVGKRGYSSTCPDDVFKAILKKAAASVVMDLRVGHPGEATSVKQGPVEFQYGSEAGRGTVDRFNNDFDRAVRRYRRCL
jgi:hypothetical protein